MIKHIGIVGCSAEGAALCYKTICVEGSGLLGPHAHPQLSLHTHSLADYVACLENDDVAGLGDLMLSSASKLEAAGAQFLICPDNTIHRAMDDVQRRSRLPWLHIAEVVATEAAARGFRKVALTGTQWLVESEVYPEKLDALGVGYMRPDATERITLDPGYQNGRYTQQPQGGLRTAARVYAAWGFSQAFFRKRLHETALGYASLEDFLVNFWEDWFLKRDANNLLAQIWTGQHADISANDVYRGDMARALGSIRADTIIMPASSDLYFPAEDAAEEARGIPSVEFRRLETDWGHVAGEGLNAADTVAIERAIRDLLAR